MEGSGLYSECSNVLDIYLVGWRENIGDRQCPDREFNLGPREQEARMPTILHLTHETWNIPSHHNVHLYRSVHGDKILYDGAEYFQYSNYSTTPPPSS